MPTFVGWLLSFGPLAATAPGTAADSRAGGACAPLSRTQAERPRVAADVRAAVALHGAVVRWDPAAGPITMWVQQRAASPVNWDEPPTAWTDAVLGAARAWHGIVPGLAFRAVRDSATAEVVVTWADANALATGAAAGLASTTAGRTTLVDVRGHARTAHVRLALGTLAGEPSDVAAVRAVARHEFGHVLGLAHHAAAKSIMAVPIRADRLQAGDRAALRLLYALPTGSQCGAPLTAAAAPRAF
jgi:hypothetical protein